jgi:hypothetical protein
LAAKLPAVFLPNKKAAEQFFGFFTANHQNKEHAAGLLQARLPLCGTGAKVGACPDWRT